MTKRIEEGAIRFNTDSNKMEVWIGDKWMQVAVSSPNFDGGDGRGFLAGGTTTPFPTPVNTIDMITIATAGDAVNFSDLTQQVREVGGAAASKTRGIRAGGTISGSPPSSTHTDTIDFITMAQQSNATDFGNLTQHSLSFGSSTGGSETRGIFMFSMQSSSPTRTVVDTIEFVTIASTGNSLDFGNLTAASQTHQCSSSPTRTLKYGGFNPNRTAEIEFITTASTGNAVVFGELTRACGRAGVCGNATRGIYAGGEDAAALTTEAEKIEYATLGNAVEFGSVVGTDREYGSAVSTPVRGVWSGGGPGSLTNTLTYQALATAGTGIDFGDMTAGYQSRGGFSNSHGGL
tara:strand:+ start:90 stop:1130 length:1041 start_codon:yes stop_codon:yes gene_type:complete